MKINEIPISSIVPYEKNAKKHNERQIKAIANSINEFGFRQPSVVDSNNVIVIGHGRFEAAKILGYETVPCVVITDLTQKQIKALRIADNKTNESDWDFDLLGMELNDLDFDMTDFGFNEAELLEFNISEEEEFEEIPEKKQEYIPHSGEDDSGERKADDEIPAYSPVYPSVSRDELHEYSDRATSSSLIAKRVIIVYNTDEETLFVKKLLGVKEEEELGVIYVAKKMMEQKNAEEN